jgi:hypothetical protein
MKQINQLASQPRSKMKSAGNPTEFKESENKAMKQINQLASQPRSKMKSAGNPTKFKD